MGDEWTIYYVLGAVLLLLWQIERLRMQIAAVGADVKAELAPNEDRREEILREWKEERTEAAKERRQQLIFGGIIVAAAIGWTIITHH